LAEKSYTSQALHTTANLSQTTNFINISKTDNLFNMHQNHPKHLWPIEQDQYPLKHGKDV